MMLIGAAKIVIAFVVVGATGKIPFVAAVSTCAEGHALQMRFSQVDSFSKNAIMSWADKHLVPGSEIVSDGLGCFQIFEEIHSTFSNWRSLIGNQKIQCRYITPGYRILLTWLTILSA